MFTLSPEFADNEPTRDLNQEVRSMRLDTEPSEALRKSATPLVSEPARLSDPVRDLKSDEFRPTFDAEPMEPLRFTARPLKKELVMPNESVMDLNIDP